jgi:hypothetical protein
MHLCYYLTSHGLGHSVRACAICEHLRPDTHVTFRTTVPESFFREELRRPFDWTAAAFDCGCLQTDSVRVDVEATLERYASHASRNEELLEHEATWLLEHKVDGIVGDIPPFPFQLAARVGLPSVAVANFTWYEIYREYTAQYPAFTGMVESLCQQYACAGMLVEVSPSLPMPYFSHRRPVGVIGRDTRDVRSELQEAFGLEPHTKIGLLYLGTFGMDMNWERLEQFRTWVFLSTEPVPGDPRNLHIIDKQRFRFADVAASVDLMISKLGYGTYSGCLSGGVPLLYVPRDSFAEYSSLNNAVRSWGHGYCLPREDFTGLRWGRVLDAIEKTPVPAPVALTGAQEAAPP